MLVSGSVTACNQGHRMVKMGFPGIISLGFCGVSCLGDWGYNPLILTIPSSSSSLYIWNQGSSYLIYWQLGGWVQIYRELEDQGFTSIYIHSWDILSYRFQLDTACVLIWGISTTRCFSSTISTVVFKVKACAIPISGGFLEHNFLDQRDPESGSTISTNRYHG